MWIYRLIFIHIKSRIALAIRDSMWMKIRNLKAEKVGSAFFK